MNQKLDAAANLMVVVVGLAIVWVLIRTYTPLGRPALPVAHEVKAGTQLAITGVDWSRSDRTLVLVLRKGCRYCEESLPFYRQLAGMQRRGEVDGRIIAVFPNDANSVREFVQSSGLSIATVSGVPLDSVHVEGTPTAILVDGRGRVLKSWVGVLSEDGKQEIVSLMKLVPQT